MAERERERERERESAIFTGVKERVGERVGGGGGWDTMKRWLWYFIIIFIVLLYKSCACD